MTSETASRRLREQARSATTGREGLARRRRLAGATWVIGLLAVTGLVAGAALSPSDRVRGEPYCAPVHPDIDRGGHRLAG